MIPHHRLVLFLVIGLIAIIPEDILKAADDAALEGIREKIRQAALREVRGSELQGSDEPHPPSSVISGVSIALVMDDRIVFEEGFGFADRRRRKEATAKTIYRVGSISKLFTAVSVMQQVEAGRLKLDEPIQTHLPTFSILDPFSDTGPITLRQLLSHRSGLVRESPIGGYFDDREPTLAESVASLQSCVLVNPPNAETRYSNIGVSVAGQAVEKVSKREFSIYQDEHILKPLGMAQSTFHGGRVDSKNLAVGQMRIAGEDGTFKEEDAPRFELGTGPAGNLYSTAGDLGRFVLMLFGKGEKDGKRIINSETLDEMFTPQLTGNQTGFGLGFSIGRFGTYKTVSHNGAVYGFSSSLVMIPEHKIAAIVLVNEDLAFGSMNRLTQLGLNLLLESKGLPSGKPSIPKGRGSFKQLQRYTGHFESESYWADLETKGGWITANFSGQVLTLRPVPLPHDDSTPEPGTIVPLGMKFLADGRYAADSEVIFQTNKVGEVTGFTALGQSFRRVDPAARKKRIPTEWENYLGSYGPSFIPLILSYKNGNLYAMTENMVDYRLRPLSRTVFALPPGMYQDEELVIECDRDGYPANVVLANMRLKRLTKRSVP